MAENINEQLEAVGFVKSGRKRNAGTRRPQAYTYAGCSCGSRIYQFRTQTICCFDNNFNDIALGIAEGILDTLQMNGDVPTPRLLYRAGRRFPQRSICRTGFSRNCWNRTSPAVTSQNNGLYRVTVGTYPTLDEAAAVERRLKQAGYQTVIVSG